MESTAAAPFAVSRSAFAADSPPPLAAAASTFQVVRRNGAVTAFDPTKINVALTKAFLAVEGDAAAASRRVHERVEDLTARVAAAVTRRLGEGGACHIEDIQDQVELALMRAGEHKVARAYIVYRDERAQAARGRRARGVRDDARPAPEPRVRTQPASSCRSTASASCASCVRRAKGCPTSRRSRFSRRRSRSLFDGIAQADVATALIMSARPLIEREPGYSFVTARLLLDPLRREALTFLADGRTRGDPRRDGGAVPGLLPRLRRARHRARAARPGARRVRPRPARRRARARRATSQFQFLGLQTLYDRYLLQWRRHALRAAAGASSCASRWGSR